MERPSWPTSTNLFQISIIKYLKSLFIVVTLRVFFRVVCGFFVHLVRKYASPLRKKTSPFHLRVMAKGQFSNIWARMECLELKVIPSNKCFIFYQYDRVLS